MTSTPGRPVDELRAVDDAFARFLAAVDRMTEDQVRGPSRLPDWTRGHVIVHVALSGEGDALTVEASCRGEVGDKYPGGAEQRAADIEAGAGASLSALRGQLVAMEQRLVDAWAALPDDSWGALARGPFGERTAADGVPARRRELLVHLVDLDVGVEPTDLPSDYLAGDAEFLAQFRPEWGQ
ncbi:MAG: maleylpyruvate isomerase family mycothiol-dependent enzyme [Acidimicrobiia bacterium]